MSTKKTSAISPILRLTQTALLTALIVLAACLPLRIFTLELTVSTIPVVVGAILLGPSTGALLGGVFGLCSFAQCFGWFFPSAFGAALLGINPWLTAIVCLVPRILMGWMAGWVYIWVRRVDKTRWLAHALACLSGALLNTLLFTVTLFLLFGRTEYIQTMQAGKPVLAFAVAFVGINGLVEAVVNFLVGTTIAKTLSVVLKQR